MANSRWTVWQDEGRVCVRGEDCVAGAVLQSWDNFHKDSNSRSGHHSTCKHCRKEDTKLFRKAGPNYVTCIHCGTDLDWHPAPTNKVCPLCAAKNQRWKKSVFLCTACPGDRTVVGGHFVATEFIETLEWGYWPEGMVVEHWMHKACVGVYRVTGELNMTDEKVSQKLELLDEAWPKGDGLFLKPGPPRLYWQGSPGNEEHVRAAKRRFTERMGGMIPHTIYHRDFTDNGQIQGLLMVHEPKLTPGLFAIGGK